MNNKMESIKEALTDFSNNILDKGIEDEKEATKYMININHNFLTDKLFLDLFPIIFSIEKCRRKIKEEKNDDFEIIIKI